MALHQRLRRLLLGDVAHRAGRSTRSAKSVSSCIEETRVLTCESRALIFSISSMPWPVFKERSTTTTSGLAALHLGQGLHHVGGLAADFEIGLAGDHVGHSAADQRMVIDQQDAIFFRLVLDSVSCGHDNGPYEAVGTWPRMAAISSSGEPPLVR